ncbi:MAG: hypothetical protein K8T10_18240 [Candidatus Eremiobacteraeota bacterium]|nr:hypothetical protein [Candidatus Eremiobacteraeota bacterium]
MKKQKFVILLILFALLTTVSFAQHTDKPWKIYGVDKPMTKLMSRYYKTPEIKVVSVGQNMHYTDDVSVCLYLAQATGTNPFKIRDWRVKAISWMDIMAKLKFNSARLFTQVGGYSVPATYRHAYREYYKWRSNKKYQMTLYDKEVRNLVQLKFMVGRFKVSPKKVMLMRSGGKNFTEMIMSELKKK